MCILYFLYIEIIVLYLNTFYIWIHFFRFQWLDLENQIIFDTKDTTTKAIYDFIENAIKKYESVLVHSVRG